MQLRFWNGKETEWSQKQISKYLSVSASKKLLHSAKRAYELLRRMEVESGYDVGIDPSFGESPFWNKDIAPDPKTYESVISVCAKTSNPDEVNDALEIAFSTYRRMIEYGMKPDVIGMLKCISRIVPSAQSEKR